MMHLPKFLTALTTPAFLLCTLSPAPAAPPIELEFQQAVLADPAGTIGATVRNGIVSCESAVFSNDGQYVLTTSKADGRLDRYDNEELTNGTAHLRLWDLAGNMIWDKQRHRGPDDNGDGRPDDQPDPEDELEVAIFSRDDVYAVAAGDDAKLEIWQVRDLTTHDILADPILVKSFTVGGGVDSLAYTHNGDLLFAGTEGYGKINVFRTQGDPSTWQHMLEASHGGNDRNGVNSVDVSADDQYVASAGSNQTGGFWRLDVTRDGDDLITDVDMIRLASMTEPTSTTREIRFQPNVDNSNGERNELIPMSAEDDQAIYVYRMQDLLDHAGGSAGGPPPIQALKFFNLSIEEGNTLEPVVFTGDGRFLVTGGDNNKGLVPSFFRIYEMAELTENAPEPDPVFLQPDNIRNTEYLDMNADSTQLASAHQDGAGRIWNVTISGSQTIASEGFNEPTDVANRWTLTGSEASTNGGNGFGTIGDVTHHKPFRGHRGSRYLAADHLQESPHTLTMNKSWNLSGYHNLQVQFAIAAATGEVDVGSDYLRLYADANGDGDFETLIAEFLPNADKNLEMTGTGLELDLTFADVFIDLEPLLPSDFDHSIRFKLEVWNSSDQEEIGFDSLRVTGEPIPPDLDSDKDGATDLDESIQGTDAHNPESRTPLIDYSWSPGQPLSTNIAGVTGRLYELERKPALNADDWLEIDTAGPLATRQNLILADPDPPEWQAFYRLVVSYP